MLFNSYPFLFVFLPATLILFYGLRHFGFLRASVAGLVLASWVFYGYWEPTYLLLLTGSVAFNFLLAKPIARAPDRASKLLMAAGVVFNLGLLGYFKYANFAVENFALATGLDIATLGVVLPIGISFFTFQQVAYLVDCRKSRSFEADFSQYALFVSFFPQLIAGPIVHHSYTRPQFSHLMTNGVRANDISLGMIIFVMGLAKKVLLADNFALYADPVFDAADGGSVVASVDAWVGALSYTLQIYFDFSGYSDMAIGLGLLFGVRLPINFNSPYKSTSIIEFWRRWHITLSAWLRDYLYIPLGGNRKGELFRLRNIFITMLLGGIWHGAGWTFIIWGAWHGCCIVINHMLCAVIPAGRRSLAGRIATTAGTLLIVIAGWVFFRATTVSGAWSLLGSMAFSPAPGAAPTAVDALITPMLAAGFAIALFAPNSAQLVGYADDKSQPIGADRVGQGLRAPALSFNPGTAALCGAALALVIAEAWRPSIFIYFNF